MTQPFQTNAFLDKIQRVVVLVYLVVNEKGTARLTDRHTNKQRQKERQTDRQTGTNRDRQTDTEIDRQR